MGYVQFEVEAYRNNLNIEDLMPRKTLAWDSNVNAVHTLSPRYYGPSVRRPINGLQMKGRRPAYMQILKKNGEPIQLMNGVGERRNKDNPNPALTSDYYTDFSILSASESRSEKYQIVETFGETFTFFFGERPRLINFNGVLMNTFDFNWRAQFWDNYDKHLRGTKLVEQQARVWVGWDDIYVGGYILQAQAEESAASPYAINFSMSMLLTDYMNISALAFEDQYIKIQDLELESHSERIGGRFQEMRSQSGRINLKTGEFDEDTTAVLQGAYHDQEYGEYQELVPFAGGPAKELEVVKDETPKSTNKHMKALGRKRKKGKAKAKTKIVWDKDSVSYKAVPINQGGKDTWVIGGKVKDADKVAGKDGSVTSSQSKMSPEQEDSFYGVSRDPEDYSIVNEGSVAPVEDVEGRIQTKSEPAPELGGPAVGW